MELQESARQELQLNEIPSMEEILAVFSRDLPSASTFLAELLSDEGRELDLGEDQAVRQLQFIEDLPFITFQDILRSSSSFGIRANEEFPNNITRYYLATNIDSNSYLQAIKDKGYTEEEILFLLGVHIADRSLYAYLEIQTIIFQGLLNRTSDTGYINTILINTLMGKLTATHFDRFRKILQQAAIDGADIHEIISQRSYIEISDQLSRDQFVKILN